MVLSDIAQAVETVVRENECLFAETDRLKKRVNRLLKRMRVMKEQQKKEGLGRTMCQRAGASASLPQK